MEIREYVTADGRCPFADWRDALADRRALARIQVRVDRLALGLFGDAKSVGEGVHEVRIDYGPGYRLYYGRRGSEVVILLTGGTKSRQQHDIETAKRYWRDCKRREA